MDSDTTKPILSFDMQRNFASYNAFITKHEYFAVLTRYIFVASRKAGALVRSDQVKCIFDKDNDGKPIYTDLEATDVLEIVTNAVPRHIVSKGGAVFGWQGLGNEYMAVDKFGSLLGLTLKNSNITSTTHLMDMEWYVVSEGEYSDTYVLVCHIREPVEDKSSTASSSKFKVQGTSIWQEIYAMLQEENDDDM